MTTSSRPTSYIYSRKLVMVGGFADFRVDVDESYSRRTETQVSLGAVDPQQVAGRDDADQGAVALHQDLADVAVHHLKEPGSRLYPRGGR